MFINASFELAANVDLLPLARKHGEPAAAGHKRAVKDLCLDGKLRLLIQERKERGAERSAVRNAVNGTHS